MMHPFRHASWLAWALVLLLGATGALHAAELAYSTALHQKPGSEVRLSGRTVVLALEIDRNAASLLSYTVKDRPFIRPPGVPAARELEWGSDVQLEVALRGAGGDTYTQRLDVGSLCLLHEPDSEPHIQGDRIQLHRDSVLVEVPELPGFDRVGVAVHERGSSRTLRRALGSVQLDARSFAPAGGTAGYEELAFASAKGYEGGFTPETAGTVHWPEEFADPDIYQVWGDEDEIDSRINIVLIPDGYTYLQKADMEAHALQMVSYLRTKTPYMEHDRFFNYILVYAYSTETGPDQCDCAIVSDTAFSTGFPDAGDACGGSGNRCLYYGWPCDDDHSSNIAAAELRAPAKDETIVLVNTTRYGGCAGSRAVYSAGNSVAVEVAVHELGHSLAGLADEYDGDPGCGTFASGVNTAINSTEGAWPEWIADIGPPHEGAQYYNLCIYRPEANCEMRSLNQPFCAVCNQQWARRIFGHPRVSPTAPIESMTPASPLNVPSGFGITFRVQTRLATGTTNSYTWTLEGPGYPEPTVVGTGTTSHVQAFTTPGVYTLTCEVVADTNFVKPSKNAGNVGVATWSIQPISLGDSDGDGYTIPAGDCDDTDASIYPDAPEVNDAKDNQCPGDAGYGLVDETAGMAGFQDGGQPGRFSWPAQTGAILYETVRSTGPEFSDACTTQITGDLFWDDAASPAPGGTYYYLVHPLTPNPGSWGSSGDGVERTIPCLGG